MNRRDRILMLLDLKALKVSGANMRRLKERAADSPLLQRALASGRVEATRGKGGRPTSAQARRRELRDGVSRAPKDHEIIPLKPRADGKTVEARLADRSGHVATSWGDKLRFRKGRDMLTTYGPGDHGVVRGDIFRDTYREVSPGRYAKNPDAQFGAFQAKRPMKIRTLEGNQRVAAGDWVMRGTRGELWRIGDADKGRQKIRDKYEGLQ